MKKKILLLVAFITFSFYYCNNNNILLYKNDLKEVKVSTKMINKTFENKVYTIKVNVGENFLGKVTSISLEVMSDNNDNKFYNVLLNNKENIYERIINLFSSINSVKGGVRTLAVGPVNTTGNCISKCTNTWKCYDQPTEAGVTLCAADCLIECTG